MKLTLKNVLPKAVLKDLAVFSLLISVGVWGAATVAAPDGAAGSDVTVKKNADGSVDAYDGGQQAQQAQPAAQSSAKHGSRHAGSRGEAPQVNVIYHLKNDIGTRKINGVSVKTNSDGSIETSDNDSAPAPSHSRPAAAHKSTSSAKKHK